MNIRNNLVFVCMYQFHVHFMVGDLKIWICELYRRMFFQNKITYFCAYNDQIGELSKHLRFVDGDTLKYAIVGHSYGCLDYLIHELNMKPMRDDLVLALRIGEKSVVDMLLSVSKLPSDLQFIYDDFTSKNNPIPCECLRIKQRCYSDYEHHIIDDNNVFHISTGNIKLVKRIENIQKYNGDALFEILMSGYCKIHPSCFKFVYDKLQFRIDRMLSKRFFEKLRYHKDHEVLRICHDNNICDFSDVSVEVPINERHHPFFELCSEIGIKTIPNGSIVINGGMGGGECFYSCQKSHEHRYITTKIMEELLNCYFIVEKLQLEQYEMF